MMKIKNIKIQNDGYVYCKSSFYSAHDGLSDYRSYTFHAGINKLIGEIDSENWAVSYLLSMFKYRPEDFVLFAPPQVNVNNEILSLDELAEYSCYMDKLYPLFSTDKSVRKLVTQGIKSNKLDCSPDEVKNLFYIDDERFERPLRGVGNEIFKAMSAIGYCNKKELFCFPWLSNKRFEYYHKNLSGTLEILESLNKVVVVPVGVADT